MPHSNFDELRFNRRIIGSIVVLMLVIGTCLGLVMCYEPTSGRKWRIAITNWPGFDYLYLADKKGFFAENDLDIELIPLNSVTDMRTAFERGAIDGYTGPIIDILESTQQSGIPGRVVLVTDFSNGGDMLLADTSITTIAELANHKVGLEATSPVARYVLAHALEDSGITQIDFNTRSYSQTIIVDQTILGNLDAVVTYEPFASRILAKRPMNNLFNSSDMPEEILDVVVVTPHVLKTDPDFNRRIQKAWQSALDYAQSHQQETRALFAQRYNVSTEEYMEMEKDLKILSAVDMQRLATSDTIQTTIAHIGDILNFDPPLTPAQVSETLAVWFQKEAAR